MDKGRRTVKERGELVFPFDMAEYEAICPNGHLVALSTGYSVFAPTWWKQWGTCQICRLGVERTVGIRLSTPGAQLVMGPIRWAGERVKEEEDWMHDVLTEHCCERCRQLAREGLACDLLAKIEEGTEITEIVSFLELLLA